MGPVTATLFNATRATQRQHAWLSYRFQQSRFRFARAVAALQESRRQRNPALLPIDVPDFPIYSFIKRGAGGLAIIKQPRAAGGAAGSGTPFQVWTETTEWGILVHADGEVDIATAPLLSRAVEAAFSKVSRVVVNLARLDYLDCKGVHVLQGFAERHAGRFAVVGSKPTIHRLFDILEVSEVLPVFRSVPEAAAYIRAKRQGTR